LTYVGSLPDGMTFTDNGDGTAQIAGTPTGRSSGVITITASNDVGLDDHQVLFLSLRCASRPSVATARPSLSVCIQIPSITTFDDLGLNYTCVLYQPCRFQYAQVTGGPLSTVGRLPSGINAFTAASSSTWELTGTPDDPKSVGKTFALTLKVPENPLFPIAARKTINLTILGPYLALGDSYSSGEANPPYATYSPASPADALGANMVECHRSLSGSWSSIAAPLIEVPGSTLPTYSYGGGGGLSRKNLACSGAQIRHFSEYWMAKDQFPQLSRITKYRPSLVTLSIGGNSMVSAGGKDLGFGALIAGCTAPNLSHVALADFSITYNLSFPCLPGHATKRPFDPHDPPVSCDYDGALDVADAVITGSRSTFMSASCRPVGPLTSLKERLVGLYASVKTTALAANPKAKVVVVGYPNISPATSIGDSWTCTAFRDPVISAKMQKIAVDLDATIADSAATAGVGYVSILSSGRFSGHELCRGADSWLQPLDYAKLSGGPKAIQDAAHPTAPGQDAMGDIVGQQVEHLIGS
jgi:hypothetical protein